MSRVLLLRLCWITYFYLIRSTVSKSLPLIRLLLVSPERNLPCGGTHFVWVSSILLPTGLCFKFDVVLFSFIFLSRYSKECFGSLSSNKNFLYFFFRVIRFGYIFSFRKLSYGNFMLPICESPNLLNPFLGVNMDFRPKHLLQGSIR